jgi:drug/metabolite transporter (DMT)-like permease
VRSRLWLNALVALVLFGCIPVVVRAVSANPYTIGVFRLAIAATVLVALNRGLPGNGKDLLRLALIGFMFFGHWLTFFLSIKASSASIAAIGLSTYGIDLIIFTALFHHERLRAIEVVSVLVAAAGAVLVVPKFDVSNRVAVGMLLSAVSAMFYASLPLLHQRWSHLRTGTRAAGQFSFALLFFAFFLPWTSWSLQPRDWYGLLFLAVGPTLIAHTLWVRVTTALSPALTSVIYYGNIPIAVVLSVLWLGEPLTGRTVMGALMIIGGGATGLLARWHRFSNASSA